MTKPTKEKTMHKDLSEASRVWIEEQAAIICRIMHTDHQSLAIAREAMINAFDKQAAELAEG